VVSRCANPCCDAKFKYLREGRLFQFRATNSAGGFVASNNAIELWWLCSRCCLSMTLVEDSAEGVKLIPLGRGPQAVRADLGRSKSG
jgi:hypothetical protein